MESIYEQLLALLKLEDKEKALNLCIDSLEKDLIDVINLYKNILSPALNNIVEEYKEDDTLIWKEHVRSGIIRTIIENCYPYVIKEKKKYKRNDMGNVIVMCPRLEDHEIGARMATDFFTIAGYNATFIGGNTPEQTMLKAVEDIKPKYISMSVTNYYNLIAAKKTIDLIKKNSNQDIIFLVGGYAFSSQPQYYKDIGGDMLIRDFQGILDLDGGVDKR